MTEVRMALLRWGVKGGEEAQIFGGESVLLRQRNLGALPWNESAGGGSGRVGGRNCILGGRRQLELYPSEHELQLK